MKSYKKALFFISILLLSILFIYPSNVKGITLSSIKYTFKNDNLYNSTDINFNNSNNVNIRNSSEYNGNYPASYSFFNEVGLEGEAISFIDIDDTSGLSTTRISESYKQHSEILNFSIVGTNNCDIRNNFTNQINASLELWINFPDTSADKNYEIQLYQTIGAINGIRFTIINSLIRVYHTGSFNTIAVYNDDSWIHIRFDFDTITDTYDIILNNKEIISTIPFTNTVNYLNQIRMIVSRNVNYSVYVDGIGYSFGSPYEINDFTDDIVGSEPIGWNSDNSVGCTTTIKDTLDGETNILDLFDATTSNTANISKIFNQSIYQEISFDIATSSLTKRSNIFFLRNDTKVIHLRILGDQIGYIDGSGYHLIENAIFGSSNNFIPIRIIFDNTLDTFDIYISTVLEGNDISYWHNTDIIDFFMLSTSTYSSGSYHVYYDNFLLNIKSYIIGSNIIPLTERILFYEVDTFEFDMISANTLYDIGRDNPSGWHDMENGYDHTNIAQDNTDISGGSITNHRVVEIEGIGSTYELTGIERNFSISEGIINISMNYNITELENNGGVFNISIYADDYRLQVRIGLTFNIPNTFGGQLTYMDSNYNYVVLKDFDNPELKLAENQDISYSIYIDSFVIFKVNTKGSLGNSNKTYYFPLINSSNEGLNSIQIYSVAADDAGQDNIISLKNVGVYCNNTSLSIDFGYLPFRISKPFWTYLAHNLFRINAFGSFTMLTASYDDWILEGNMEILKEPSIYNYSLEVINLYFTEFVHFPSSGIPDPIIVFFITSQFNISSITIDGIKFFDDTPHDFGFASYSSGGVDNSKSYFYINEVNKVQYYHYTDQNNIKEFIQMEFTVGGISTNNSAVQFTTSKSSGAYGFFRVKYVSVSTIFEIPSISKTTTSNLPNDKSIISYIILITDNNDNTISGLTTGSISKFTLLFTDDIITTIVITLSLVSVLIPLIIIMIPSLAFSSKFGKFMLAPFFLLMSIVCVIGGLIPNWLFFIIILSLSLFIFQENEGGKNTY